MASRRNPIGPGDLPDVIPVFPLPGALLLPGGQLPLNIFEPRYLDMVDDALRSDRLIGMIQPASEVEAARTVPQLAEIGCVGRLVQFVETGDGRYLITLAGVSRFRRIREPAVTTAYRRCACDYSGFEADFEPDAGAGRVDRDALLRAFRALAQAKAPSIDWDNVGSAPIPALVNAFAAMGPFGLQEKQALLEAPDLAARAEMLIAIAEFERAQSGERRSLQ